jgi:hypothetical protein
VEEGTSQQEQEAGVAPGAHMAPLAGGRRLWEGVLGYMTSVDLVLWVIYGSIHKWKKWRTLPRKLFSEGI